MPFVSVTRLHLRSLWTFPAFAWHTLRSTQQVERASGLVGGYLAIEGVHGFWTVSVWDNEAAMRAYRNSGAHLQAMPKLLGWCDEASFVHWAQPSSEPPGPADAVARIRAEGKLSKVRRPSPTHQAGERAPASAIIRTGKPLRPQRP